MESIRSFSIWSSSALWVPAWCERRSGHVRANLVALRSPSHASRRNRGLLKKYLFGATKFYSSFFVQGCSNAEGHQRRRNHHGDSRQPEGWFWCLFGQREQYEHLPPLPGTPPRGLPSHHSPLSARRCPGSKHFFEFTTDASGCVLFGTYTVCRCSSDRSLRSQQRNGFDQCCRYNCNRGDTFSVKRNGSQMTFYCNTDRLCSVSSSSPFAVKTNVRFPFSSRSSCSRPPQPGLQLRILSLHHGGAERLQQRLGAAA